nr:hypothetical protein [Pseudonocardia sp. AL041005-10]
MNDQQTGTSSPSRPARAVRDLADDHVRRLAELDPVLAGDLGWTERQDELPDLSPTAPPRSSPPAGRPWSGWTPPRAPGSPPTPTSVAARGCCVSASAPSSTT